VSTHELDPAGDGLCALGAASVSRESKRATRNQRARESERAANNQRVIEPEGSQQSAYERERVRVA
jgi:hypothetical protein